MRRKTLGGPRAALAALAAMSSLAPAALGGSASLETVRRYREARRAGDAEALGGLLSPNSRIWFDRVTGPGRPRAAGGGGPWADWDAFFRSEARSIYADEDERSVRTLVSETNDWYRLVERAPSRYFITYYFDAQGRIEGMLIHGLPEAGPRSDRLDEFRAWARARKPGLMERLEPEGELDPALPKARLWKQELLEWRAELGLPDPLPAEGGDAR